MFNDDETIAQKVILRAGAKHHSGNAPAKVVTEYRKKIQQQQHEATWAMAMEAAANLPDAHGVAFEKREQNYRNRIRAIPCPPLQTTNEKTE